MVKYSKSAIAIHFEGYYRNFYLFKTFNDF